MFLRGFGGARPLARRYVGVLEDLERSLRVLAALLPAFFSAPPLGDAGGAAEGRVFEGVEARVRPKHDRRDASAVLPVNVSDAHWRELEALNALDLELYAAISERHEAIAEACLGPRRARR